MMKKRVLEISGSLRIGGLENIVMDIIRSLDPQRYAVDVLVFGEEKGDYETEIIERGGQVIHIKNTGNLFDFEKKIDIVFCDYGPYDIVHSHVYFKSGSVMRVAAKHKINMRLSHAHSVKRKDENGIIRWLYQCYARKLLVKYSTQYIACSNEAGRHVFGEKAFKKNGMVLPNCINVDRFAFSEKIASELRKEYNVDSNTIVLGQVGHLTAAKNQRFLLELFQMYSKKHNSVLFLIGEGELEDELKQYSRDLGMDDNVFFLGKRDDVNRLMSIMDVYVCTSLNEGFGIVMIEAQANGLPVVVEKNVVTKAINELENCFTVEGFDDFEDWEEEIDRALRRGRDVKVVNNLLNSSFSDKNFSKYIKKIYNDGE